MAEKKDEDLDASFVMEEFEWALQDPTAERLREMGEVVTIITSKLVSAIDALENEINGLKSTVSGMESQISSLSARVSKGVAASPSAGPSAAADAAPPMAKAPTPSPTPAPAPSGPTSMMGELKQLLAARRRKAESGE